MIVFDTEDNSAELLAAGKSGFDKQITQIAAVSESGKKFHNNGNVTEFLKWCHERGEKQNVWAFNCQYDIGNLCHSGRQLRLDDFDLRLVKSRFISGSTAGLNFFDVMNISGAGSSVMSLGSAVGLPKFGVNVYDGDTIEGETPYGYEKKTFAKFPANEQKKFWKYAQMEKAELFRNKDYVLRDCEIPMRWLKFVKEKISEYGIDNIPATLGGLSCKMFTATGGENWHEATDESRQSIMGARVELFNCGGRGRIAYLDVNSLYPWCMTQLFPVSMDKLDRLEGYGIAACDVAVPEMFVAPLPWRDEEGRLLFPVGKFSGVWTIHELRNAMRQGVKVLKAHWILGSAEGKPFYRDYITTMYQNRLAAQSPAESLFWKLLLNNLYGRLAIGGEISRTMLLTDENKHNGAIFGRKILCEHQMPLPEFSNYLHAAHVLSYARVRLFEFLKKVPPKDLIYCDTDSMMFFCEGELPIETGKDLGMMKLEKMGSRCEPILPKTYIFDDEYKAKGVPKRKAKKFITDKTVTYESPYKMRESIVFYEENNKRKLSVWREVQKNLNANYEKKRKKGEFFLPKKINQISSISAQKNELFALISQH